MLLFPYETHLTNVQKRESNKRRRLRNSRRKRDRDEGRTGRGEGEGDRNKDRGKQIEGVSGWVGGNQEEGDHSMGKENRKIISLRYAFAQERANGREKKTAGDCPRFCTPGWERLSSADQPHRWASMTDLRGLGGARWIPAEYTDERARSLGLSAGMFFLLSLIHFNYKGLVFLQGKALSRVPP